MPEKRRVTVNLDAVNVEWLDAQCDNRSAFLNDLLEEARGGGVAGEAMMSQFERRRLKAQAEMLMNQYETVQEQLSQIDKRQQAVEARKEAELHEAAEALEETELVETNPAVKTQAEKVGIPPRELIEKIKAEQ